MTKALQIKSFNKMIGVGFLMIFVLVGCSGSGSTEFTQPPTITEEVFQNQPTLIPATEEPSATNTGLPTATDIGYPAPGFDQSTQEPILEQGYPAPEMQVSPPAGVEQGYPSPEHADPPPLKTGLVATNPSEVNLASGDLQLIEFFAFW